MIELDYTSNRRDAKELGLICEIIDEMKGYNTSDKYFDTKNQIFNDERVERIINLKYIEFQESVKLEEKSHDDVNIYYEEDKIHLEYYTKIKEELEEMKRKINRLYHTQGRE